VPHAVVQTLEGTASLDFDSLYESTVDVAYRVLQGMGVHSAEVEDALQDVFVVAHRKWSGFRGESKPSTWIAAIAVRVAHDYRRRNTRKPSECLDSHAPTLVAPTELADAALIQGEALQVDSR
jgi:RNA polymerase sigma-70 factor (ECF subfamily)